MIGERSIIGAGALVTGGTVIPPGSLVLGSPAKVVRTLPLDEQAKIKSWAVKYVAGSRRYLVERPPLERRHQPACAPARPENLSHPALTSSI